MPLGSNRCRPAQKRETQTGNQTRSQEWTFSQIYTCRQKSRRNVPANQPPNSNPLLQIQVPKANQCIPVRHLVVMYNSVATARMLHRILRLSTGIYLSLQGHSQCSQGNFETTHEDQAPIQISFENKPSVIAPTAVSNCRWTVLFVILYILY